MEILGMKVVVNDTIPDGEVHFRDSASGKLLGKIINSQTPETMHEQKVSITETPFGTLREYH